MKRNQLGVALMSPASQISRVGALPDAKPGWDRTNQTNSDLIYEVCFFFVLLFCVFDNQWFLVFDHPQIRYPPIVQDYVPSYA